MNAYPPPGAGAPLQNRPLPRPEGHKPMPLDLTIVGRRARPERPRTAIQGADQCLETQPEDRWWAISPWCLSFGAESVVLLPPDLGMAPSHSGDLPRIRDAVC